MSENYYARLNICGCCGRYDELHICQISFAWQTLFQAYPDRRLTSYQDWLELLEYPGTEIYDEYSNRVSLEEFKATCVTRAHQGRPRDLSGFYGEHAPYQDREGYWLYQGDFS